MKYITQQQMYETQREYIPIVEPTLTDRLYSPVRDNIEELIQYNVGPLPTQSEIRKRQEEERKRQDDYHKGIKREKKSTDIIEKGIGELLKRIIPHG